MATHVGGRVLDGKAVATINSCLRATPERPDPVQLAANADSSFQASILVGIGFTLTPAERDGLVAKDRKNAERIFPYLGGEEVNTSPTQDFDRYVINFGEAELGEAERWPDLITILREKVKPERERGAKEARTFSWWQHWRIRTELYAAIRPLRRCLVQARVSRHVTFSFQPADRVLNEKLVVFPFEDCARFAVMQSRVHTPWTWLLSSTMKEDLNYAPSDCFETFPFPRDDKLTQGGTVDAIGATLYAERAALMVERQQGLTTTYNQLKDPACTAARILALRTLQEQMDRAVLDAYGWTDLAVPAYCPLTDADQKQLLAFEDEVIDRRFALNAARAKEEELR